MFHEINSPHEVLKNLSAIYVQDEENVIRDKERYY